MISNGADPRAALIAAHPGHELLLHRWMELHRPLVFLLTDGSGGGQSDRRSHSRTLLEAVGASAGPVFGPFPDKAWYAAILAGDLAPFLDARDAIVEACVRAGVRTLVADAMEGFNPMHDLCGAMARAAAGRIAAALGEEVEVLEHPIEREWFDTTAARLVALDGPALERKLAAAHRYAPLAAEVEQRAASPRLALERLRPAPGAEAWPRRPEQEPYYERFGRQRLEQGAYDRLITYAGHVRPIAVALGALAHGEPVCASPPSSPCATNAPISPTASRT